MTLKPHDLYFNETRLVPSYSCGPDDTLEAMALVERSVLRAADLVTHRFPLERVVEAYAMAQKPESLKVIGGASMLKNMAAAVDNVFVAPEVRAYVLDLVQATRNHPSLLFGASPRAGLALLRTASGYAVTAGRDYLRPDDVKAVAAWLSSPQAPTNPTPEPHESLPMPLSCGSEPN